jgi:hypothetical protein
MRQRSAGVAFGPTHGVGGAAAIIDLTRPTFVEPETVSTGLREGLNISDCSVIFNPTRDKRLSIVALPCVRVVFVAR